MYILQENTTKASLLTTAAFGMAFTQATAAAEIIDNPKTAQTVADYITANCPANSTEAKNPEKVKLCIAAGADMSLSIAKAWDTYLDEVVKNTSPFGAGLARGDLKSSCLWSMEELGGKDYSNLQNYRDAAFNAVKNCEESIVRGGEQVEIDYQPTARNTVSCHMNRLKGLKCEY